jgi:hypothetical protein
MRRHWTGRRDFFYRIVLNGVDWNSVWSVWLGPAPLRVSSSSETPKVGSKLHNDEQNNPSHSVCITNGFCGYIRLTENKPILGSPITTNTPLVLYVYEDVKSQTYAWLRTAFFWIITQRVVVIYCRRCGTTYQPHLRRYRKTYRSHLQERRRDR